MEAEQKSISDDFREEIALLGGEICSTDIFLTGSVCSETGSRSGIG